jgi:hypothetical protein
VVRGWQVKKKFDTEVGGENRDVKNPTPGPSPKREGREDLNTRISINDF